MQSDSFKEKSYWLTTREYQPGKPLNEDKDVDVAIVGGGFTGLSTAYHLKQAEPDLRIAILESRVIGFGASGRNGGFNMTLFGLTLGITALRFGRSKAREAHLYMEKSVDLLRDLVAAGIEVVVGVLALGRLVLDLVQRVVAVVGIDPVEALRQPVARGIIRVVEGVQQGVVWRELLLPDQPVECIVVVVRIPSILSHDLHRIAPAPGQGQQRYGAWRLLCANTGR